MFKVKNIKLDKIDADKNKLNSIKPVKKNSISSKLNQKKEFYRSLEAFSDCVYLFNALENILKHSW